MTSSADGIEHLAAIDMNVPANLQLFSQIITFKNDFLSDELVLHHRSTMEQRTLQCIAHSQGLEYEYSLATRSVRISRATPAQTLVASESENLCLDVFVPLVIDLSLHGPGNEAFPLVDYDLPNGMHSNGSAAALGEDIGMPAFPNSESAMETYISWPKSQEVPPLHVMTISNEMVPVVPVELNMPVTTENGYNVDLEMSAETCYHKETVLCKSCGLGFCTRKSSVCQHCAKLEVNNQSANPKTSVPPQGRVSNHPVSASRAELGPIWDLNPSIGVDDNSRYASSSGPAMDTTSVQFNIGVVDMPPVRNESSHPMNKETSRNVKTRSRMPSLSRRNKSAASSVHSGSQKSATSAGSAVSKVSSGRQGPLNELARVGMNAVRNMGACWRCKFLRNKYDPLDPCPLCPKGTTSNWAALGCRRGKFKSRMPRILLCEKLGCVIESQPPSLPQRPPSGYELFYYRARSERIENGLNPPENAHIKIAWTFLSPAERELYEIPAKKAADQYECEMNEWRKSSPFKSYSQYFSDLNSAKAANKLHREDCQRRAEWLTQAAFAQETDRIPSDLSSLARSIWTQPERHESGYGASFQPLTDCILDTVWELLEIPSSLAVIGAAESPYLITQVLLSAAKYQAKLDTDKLIAQSLICLRGVLEALRIQASGMLSDYTHSRCGEVCEIESIQNLSISLGIYLDELSEVFFLKANMLDKSPWWLSVFYSFCIQSMVRKGLMKLVTKRPKVQTEVPTMGIIQNAGVHQYLYLPLRLFIASSETPGRILDPVARSNTFDHEDYVQAQSAVNQPEWRAQGIRSSADFLRRIFQDTGCVLRTQEMKRDPKTKIGFKRSRKAKAGSLQDNS